MNPYYQFDRAQEALSEANRKVASLFLQEPKKVRFVFLSYIANPKGQNKGICLGLCIHQSGTNEIQLLIGASWQKTAVHELVHLYNPNMKEYQIRKITEDVCEYLKRYISES